MEGILDIFISESPELFCLYCTYLRLASSIIPWVKIEHTLPDPLSLIVIVLAGAQIGPCLFISESLLLGKVGIGNAGGLVRFGFFVRVVARGRVEVVGIVQDLLGFRKVHDEYNLREVLFIMKKNA